MPVRALGAPQTTCTGSPPASTMQSAQPVGVGMRLGLDDAGDDEAFELGARVLDALDLEADAGERVDDLGEGGRGVEMVLQPGQGEFHALTPETPRDEVRSANAALRLIGRWGARKREGSA